MGEHTHISWCDHTFNPWIGCTKVSVGEFGACEACYAENLMDTRYGVAKWGNHPRHRTGASNWRQPVRWNKAAEATGTRPFVFCASLADVFDNQVDAVWRADLFSLIRETPHLTWLLLTKRPQNILRLWAETFADDSGMPVALTSEFWPRNAAIGCTIVTQAEADRDLPHLLRAKAALKPAFAFVSMEPLMGAVDLTRVCVLPRKPGSPRAGIHLNALRGHYVESGCKYLGDWDVDGPVPDGPAVGLDWVITGGETDQGVHKARPSNPQWFRDLRDQCARAGVAYHHKQNGEWVSVSEVEGPQTAFHEFDDHRCVRRIGKARAGRTVDGAIHDARPAVPS